MAWKNENHIGSAEQDLYSRKYTAPNTDERTSFKEEATDDEDVRRNWQTPVEKRGEKTGGKKKKEKSRTDVFFHRLLIGSIVFFVVAAGVAAVLFFTGVFSVSGENVDITVEGSSRIRSGEEMAFDIVVTNNNKARLSDASLTVQYPSGVYETEDIRSAKTRDSISVGDLEPGEQARFSQELVMFGKRDEGKEVSITLEYGLEGSNATLVKEKVHTVTLTTSPISVSLSSPGDVSGDQPVAFELRVVSNVSRTLHDVVVHAHHPFGFDPQEADPQPVDGTNNFWRFGDLEPGEEHVIRLTGTLEAETNEERTIIFTTGSAEGTGGDKVSVAFDETKRTLSVRPPLIGLDVLVSGSAQGTAVGSLGERTRADVRYRNNLDVPISDLSVTAAFDGNVFDRRAVSTRDGGFYRSSTNEVIWNPNTNPELRQLDVDESGDLSMRVGSFSSERVIRSGITNPFITISVLAEGRQNEDPAVSEMINVVAQRTVRFSTTINADAFSLYEDGPFNNAGPVPPEADTLTTYTIGIELTNRFNDVTDTVFRGRLPQYVEWAGQTTNDQTISYNPNNREVTWEVGELQKQTGYGRAPKQAAFQVRVTPTINHIGTRPELLTNGIVRGRDTFTDRDVRAQVPDVTTSLSKDDSYSASDGDVQR